MKHSRFYAILRSLTVAYKCLMERETTTIGRQRLLSLIYYTLFLSTGLSISLLTRTGPSTGFYVCVNSIFSVLNFVALHSLYCEVITSENSNFADDADSLLFDFG